MKRKAKFLNLGKDSKKEKNLVLDTKYISIPLKVFIDTAALLTPVNRNMLKTRQKTEVMKVKCTHCRRIYFT